MARRGARSSRRSRCGAARGAPAADRTGWAGTGEKVCQCGVSGRNTLGSADAAGQRDEHVGVVEQLALALGNVGATHDDELEQFKLSRPSKSPRRKKVDLT